MNKKILKKCSRCNTEMKLIACPDGSRKWQCQNPACPNSRVTGVYPKQQKYIGQSLKN